MSLWRAYRMHIVSEYQQQQPISPLTPIHYTGPLPPIQPNANASGLRNKWICCAHVTQNSDWELLCYVRYALFRIRHVSRHLIVVGARSRQLTWSSIMFSAHTPTEKLFLSFRIGLFRWKQLEEILCRDWHWINWRTLHRFESRSKCRIKQCISLSKPFCYFWAPRNVHSTIYQLAQFDEENVWKQNIAGNRREFMRLCGGEISRKYWN